MTDSPTPSKADSIAEEANSPMPNSVLPSVDDLIEAMSGRDTDDPISVAVSAMFALSKQRWLSLSMLVDPNLPDIDAMLLAADRLAAALPDARAGT